MTDSLIAPTARARFVVTLPPAPSLISHHLQTVAGSSFITLTDTQDAFLHLARRAQDRLVIMTPYIDAAGCSWAADLFEATIAPNKLLVLRDREQLTSAGAPGKRLAATASRILTYAFASRQDNGEVCVETFHAKVVLADGVAAYVGSANFLYRSREMNLECGFLLEGSAVAPVASLVDAVLAMLS